MEAQWKAVSASTGTFAPASWCPWNVSRTTSPRCRTRSPAPTTPSFSAPSRKARARPSVASARPGEAEGCAAAETGARARQREASMGTRAGVIVDLRRGSYGGGAAPPRPPLAPPGRAETGRFRPRLRRECPGPIRPLTGGAPVVNPKAEVAHPSPSAAASGALARRETLTITDNRTGKTYEVPIREGTLRAMDLRQIRTGGDDFGLMSYDPAFANTASCRSAVTFIDGDKGILWYRGYAIEELAEKSSYLETAYLIVKGELPTRDELDRWKDNITNHMILHENIKKYIDGFQYDAHPMGML